MILYCDNCGIELSSVPFWRFFEWRRRYGKCPQTIRPAKYQTMTGGRAVHECSM